MGASTRGVIALLACAVVAATACERGVPADRPPQSDVPMSAASPGNAGFKNVVVWFASDGCLVPRERSAPETEPLVAAMEALLEGPTTAESEAGIFTTIPPGARLLGLEVKDRVATVDFSREFEPSSGTTGELLTLGQVVYTLTESPDIRAVRFKLEGRFPRFFASHGFMLRAKPQQRGYYRGLLRQSRWCRNV